MISRGRFVALDGDVEGALAGEGFAQGLAGGELSVQRFGIGGEAGDIYLQGVLAGEQLQGELADERMRRCSSSRSSCAWGE